VGEEEEGQDEGDDTCAEAWLWEKGNMTGSMLNSEGPSKWE
jgi:hypothetical protein